MPKECRNWHPQGHYTAAATKQAKEARERAAAVTEPRVPREPRRPREPKGGGKGGDRRKKDEATLPRSPLSEEEKVLVSRKGGLAKGGPATEKKCL